MSMTMQRQPERQRSYSPAPEREERHVEKQRQAREEQREREREEQQRYYQQQRVLEEQRQRELVTRYKDEILTTVDQALKKMGYNPPSPSPLRRIRTLEDLGAAKKSDVAHVAAISLAMTQLEREFAESVAFVASLKKSIGGASPFTMLRVKGFLGQTHPAIARAKLSLQPPDTSAELKIRMDTIERFLADQWEGSPKRGVLTIHRDEGKQQTILQIGLNAHGAVYITIPGLLAPPELAERSLHDLIKRLRPFTAGVDPLAVVNGAHQQMNFNYLFKPGRVIRAPSGDTTRLSANLVETRNRERLSPGNTIVLNSTPATAEEYTRVFPDDRTAQHWPAWTQEAGLWSNAATSTGFAPATESSREAFLAALTQRKNVIVIVAHCNGQDIFMPHPPPTGTQVSPQYLLQHQAEIAANKPFVYLFSCEAGNLQNLENFASTLLEAGAAGVVASQKTVGSAEGRSMLARILDERRGTPPIEDLWTAMRDTNYFDMEVFLA